MAEKATQGDTRGVIKTVVQRDDWRSICHRPALGDASELGSRAAGQNLTALGESWKCPCPATFTLRLLAWSQNSWATSQRIVPHRPATQMSDILDWAVAVPRISGVTALNQH